MNENYIVINGKKSELTEEQLKALRIKVETKRKTRLRMLIGLKTITSSIETTRFTHL